MKNNKPKLKDSQRIKRTTKMRGEENGIEIERDLEGIHRRHHRLRDITGDQAKGITMAVREGEMRNIKEVEERIV